MAKPSTQPLTLVTGATGKTGRRVLARLETLGVPVRAGSRSGTPAFDWNDRATWRPALDGVARVYIAFAPDLAVPGADAIIQAFVDQAIDMGVRRLVLLSGRGEPAAQRCEQIVLGGDVDATVVRASWFAQNFSEGEFVVPVRQGVLALPVGDVVEPFVDADDIADVAVAALTEDGHAGEVYEVTGPRLLSFSEVMAELGRASGRDDLRFVPISRTEFADGLRAAGHDAPMVEFLDWLMANTLDGRNAFVADGVERALGRPPRDFRAYAADAAATGIWEAA